LKVAGRHISVDAPFAQGEDGSLLDVLADANGSSPESQLMIDSLTQEVQRALATLTTRESEVIGLYFGLNNNASMTLEEIGEKFNLTRERVRQIKEKATRRLRHTSRSTTLKTFLG
jgi:RNA polymerase primary sigma factor